MCILLTIGLKLKETKSCGGAVIITGFSRDADNNMLQAEASGMLSVGMLMLSINGTVVFGRPFEDVSKIAALYLVVCMLLSDMW